MAEWETTKIKYNGVYWNGLTYSPQDLCDENEGTLVLRSSNIKDGQMTYYDNVYVKCPIESKALIKKNDILICSRNGSKELIGKNAIYTKDEKMAFGAFMMIYRCKNPRYMYYVLNSDIFKENIGLFSTSTVNQLTGAIFGNIKFPLPPEIIQKQIVQLLDPRCAKIDSLKNDIEKQIETLEQYKKSVITEAVTKGINPDVKMKDSGIEWIGEIPEHWETKRAKYIFTPRNDRGNKIELQLLSPTQKYGVIPQALYDEISGMNSVKLKENTDFNLLKTCHKGDYCISLRSFQGGFEYSKYEGVVSPAYQIFYPTIKIADGYYKYLFKEKNFIEKINSFTLSLRDGKPISYFDFSNMYLPLPSAEEQKEIADFLDSKCSAIDSIITTKKQQLEKLEEYKKSLIFEYVTGKREV